MKISIIMAAYESQATIGEAVKSFLAQCYPDKELIIIDGASRDDTCAIVEAVKTPQIHVYSEPDEGIYDALNKGIALTNGEIVGLLHTDDCFAESTILAQVANMFERCDVDGVYGDLEYVAREQPSRVIRYWRSGAYQPVLLKKGWMPPHPTLFLHRDVFARYGDYDTTYRISADYEAMLRWLTRGKIRLAYIPNVLVRMRVGGESNRSLERLVRKSREDYRAIRENGVGGMGTLMNKNLSKLSQFWKRA